MLFDNLKNEVYQVLSCMKWVLLIAIAVPLFVPLSLPYPYDHFDIVDIPEYYSSNSIYNAATLSPMEYAKKNDIPVSILSESTTTKMFSGVINGAESVAVSTLSNESSTRKLVMIDKYGVLRTAMHDTKQNTYELTNYTLYVGPGRILGYHLQSPNEIVACDSVKGLILIDTSEKEGTGDRIRVLSNSISSDGMDIATPVNYANDLDIVERDSHTIVYFSSSTTLGVVAFNSKERYFDTMRSFLLTWLAGDVSGRLLAYNMTSRRTTVEMNGLFYANGVAVAPDQSYVLVVETVGLRVWKYFLSGPRRGNREVFIENLPGVPDGITQSLDKKSFCISLVAPLSPVFSKGNRMMQSPFARWLSAWLLISFHAQLTNLGVLKKIGCVMKLEASSGKVEEMLIDSSGSTVSTVSAVAETKEQLLFGNLGGDGILTWNKNQG